MRYLMLCLLLALSPATPAETWRVTGDEQFAPYSFVQGDDNTPRGLDVELVAVAGGRHKATGTLFLGEELILDECFSRQMQQAHVITQMQAGELNRHAGVAVTDEAHAERRADADGG